MTSTDMPLTDPLWISTELDDPLTNKGENNQKWKVHKAANAIYSLENAGQGMQDIRSVEVLPAMPRSEKSVFSFGSEKNLSSCLEKAFKSSSTVSSEQITKMVVHMQEKGVPTIMAKDFAHSVRSREDIETAAELAISASSIKANLITNTIMIQLASEAALKCTGDEPDLRRAR